jgi:hypothetical protein
MVNYDVDTETRPLTYFILAFASISSVPLLAWLLSTFSNRLDKYGPLGDAGSRFALFVSGVVSPFVIFVGILAVFNYILWLLPIPLLGRTVSGIPNLGGTWTGDLSRTSLDPTQPPETGEVNCRIRQTWQHIDFVFSGPYIPVPAPRRIMRRIHSTRGHALTVGMFVKNRDNVHVRYIYAAGSMSMLNPHDVAERSGEGTAVLYLIRRAGKKYLQGTYYGDKLRSGNVYLEYVPPWWSRLLRAPWTWLRNRWRWLGNLGGGPDESAEGSVTRPVTEPGRGTGRKRLRFGRRPVMSDVTSSDSSKVRESS